MALSAYLQETQRLLNDHDPPFQIYSAADLTLFINLGRGQIAIESECLPQRAQIKTSIGQRGYLFSAATLVADPTPQETLAGISGVVKITLMGVMAPSSSVGQYPMNFRSYPWFRYYYLQNPNPPSGMPVRWTVLQPGLGSTAGSGGTLFVDPIPDAVYTLDFMGTCVPVPLVDDTTPEAIPYPWTDAIPWYAAFNALWGAQRFADAKMLWEQFETFTRRGMFGTTPRQLSAGYPTGAMPQQK